MGKAAAAIPYVAVVFLQCSIAGMSLLCKAAVSAGMKPSIFFIYKQAFATIVFLPFGFCFKRRRKEYTPITWIGLFKIFFASTLGITLSFNLFLNGLKYTSATFGTAITSIVPSLVFIIAICFRIESLDVTKCHGMAKVLGTLVGLSGVMVFTFYNGPSLFHTSNHQNSRHNSDHQMTHTKDEWIKGSVIALFSEITYAAWLIIQALLLKQFPGTLRLTLLQYGFSLIPGAIYAAAVERNLHSWKIGWNIQLLAVAYCGLIVTGICFWVLTWLIEKKGPVFIAMFGPLALIIAAIFSALFLNETLHWGSVLGGGLLVIGLYIFLCGRNKEAQNRAQLEESKSSVEQA